MSAYLWTKLILTFVGELLSASLFIGFYVVMWKMARMWMASLNPTLSRNGSPQGKYFLRRLFCRHRGGVARIRDPYGRHYTGCVRCGHDVNEGKAKEEWR